WPCGVKREQQECRSDAQPVDVVAPTLRASRLRPLRAHRAEGCKAGPTGSLVAREVVSGLERARRTRRRATHNRRQGGQSWKSKAVATAARSDTRPRAITSSRARRPV